MKKTVKLAAVLAGVILPLALSAATIAVNIDDPIKDQRDSRAGAGVGYSGSMGHERYVFTKHFFVNEPDKTWETLRAGGYWLDRAYGTSQSWQHSIRLEHVTDPEEKAKLEKSVLHPRYYFDWCKKHGVRSLNVLECSYGITNYVTGAGSSHVDAVKKGILDYVKWIVDNGYRDQIIGFELGNEPYFGSDPEDSAYRWSKIVPEIKKIFPEVDIGISVAEYREGDPDIAAVRRRSTAVDKWFEGGDYFGFSKVNQWSGRFIVASSNYLHHISHVIYHFYGGNTADGLGPCGYNRIRHFAKAFPEVAQKRVWITEWRERSDEDCRCHQMFSSTLTKAHYILSSTAAKMFDCSALHTATSLSGGFAITDGLGQWHVQWDPAGRNFSDPDFTGKPRMEVGPAGPMFRLYNEALQGHPLICAFGGWDRVKDPEKDWTGVLFYNNTGRYEAWHGKNEEGPQPPSGGGPTWVAAASPDRTSVNLLVCNSSHNPWTAEFVFPGYKITGPKKVRAYTCRPDCVQRHMIPGEAPLAWEEQFETSGSSFTIKPYTIATVSYRLEKPTAVVGLLSDTFITASTSSCVRLAKVLEYFRDRGVTAVLHAGGIVDRRNGGDFSDYARVRAGIFTNSAPREVFSFSACDAGGKAGADIGKAWKDASAKLGVKHALYDTFEIGGVSFVVAPENPDREKYESLVSKAAAGSSGDTVVVLQHRPAEGTTVKSSGADASNVYAGGGSTRAFLDKHPNLLVLSGHVRSNPADERSVWQGPFSAVAVGGLCEYAEPYTGNSENKATNHIALVMSVFKDEIVFSRYNPMTREYNPLEWSIARRYDPAKAVYAPAALSSRSSTGHFSKNCSKVTVGRDKLDRFTVNFQEACSIPTVPQTWKYRVELFDTKSDSAKPFARKDVRGSWDLPGRFTDWHRKTRPKSAAFSAALLSGVSSVRAVVTPVSFAGESGGSIKFENSVPSPANDWKCVWTGAVKTESSAGGTRRITVDRSAFAGKAGDMFSVVFSFAADADARLDLEVGGRDVPGSGFIAVGLGEGNPLKYAFEFVKGSSDDVAIRIGATVAKHLAISNVSVFRAAK